MKKNILTVVILVLVLANLVLTAIMMFTILPSAKKTDKMITDICSVLELELAAENKVSEEEKVPMEDLTFYDLEDELIFSLKMANGDEKAHYAVVHVSLALNSKDKGYKTYGGDDMSAKDGLIKNAVMEVIGQYTFEEAPQKTEEMEEKILKKLQEMFDSKFIYQVLFSDIKFQ